jgi:hypothetical protein
MDKNSLAHPTKRQLCVGWKTAKRFPPFKPLAYAKNSQKTQHKKCYPVTNNQQYRPTTEHRFNLKPINSKKRLKM